MADNTVNIAIIGKPASGKSAFIQSAKGLPIPKKYVKTIGCEAHPIGTHNDRYINLWEFGHYTDVAAMMERVDAVIYMTTSSKPIDYHTDKPMVIVRNKHRSAVFDTHSVLNDITNQLH